MRKASRALTVWDRMVASAAPPTPMCSPAINHRSRMTLRMEAVIRYRMGLRLSPTDCRILAPTLYMTTDREPMKYTRK